MTAYYFVSLFGLVSFCPFDTHVDISEKGDSQLRNHSHLIGLWARPWGIFLIDMGRLSSLWQSLPLAGSHRRYKKGSQCEPGNKSVSSFLYGSCISSYLSSSLMDRE